MDNNGRLKLLVAYIIFIGIVLLLISRVSPYSFSSEIQTKSLRKEPQMDIVRSSKAQEVNKVESQKEDKASLETPAYNETEFSSLVGEILVNPQYTGRITTVRTFPKTGPPKDNPIVDVRETSDGWGKVVVSQSESDAIGLVATGRKGSLRISLPKGELPNKSDKLQPLDDLVIGFGELNAAFLMPLTEVSQPSGFGIDIFDHKENKFINGDIVAVRKDQVAVKFHDLPSTVINRDGMIRVTLKKTGDDSISADLKAWGYNIIIPDTNVGKPAPITAKVFGLPGEAKLKFTFEPLPGQDITPFTRILTIKRINLGAPLATIVSSISGEQPLSVLVEKVN
jgi:hypothetical protein